MKLFACVAAAVVASVALPSPASACSPERGNDPWEMDPTQASDSTPPSPPTVEGFTERKEGSDLEGMCGDSAALRLRVSATDDQTTPAQIGYEVTIVGGDRPLGFDPESKGRITALSDRLTYGFDFDADSFSVDLEVRAVDGNGNVGPPTLITVEDDDGGGCTTGAGGMGFGMLAFATAFTLRRRRSCSRPGTSRSSAS